MLKKILVIAAMTAACALIYWGLRSMPTAACGFLHYAPEGVDANGIEMCQAGATSFVDLSALTFPVKLEVSFNRPPEAGELVHCQLRLIGPAGKIIPAHAVARSHTELVHVMLVDEALQDYQHLHPQPVDAQSIWTVDWMPRVSGRYHLFAQWVQAQTKREVIAQSLCTVASAGDHPKPQKTALGACRLTQRVEDVCFELSWPGAPALRTYTPYTLTLKIYSKAVLEPVMGSYCHFVGFDEGLKGIAHLHPIPTGKEKNHPAELEFILSTPLAGRYRFWAQCKLDEKLLFVPFDLEVTR